MKFKEETIDYINKISGGEHVEKEITAFQCVKSIN